MHTKVPFTPNMIEHSRDEEVGNMNSGVIHMGSKTVSPAQVRPLRGHWNRTRVKDRSCERAITKQVTMSFSILEAK